MYKWEKILNRHFSKEDIKMPNKHMKKYLTSCVIRKLQIKTTRYHISPTSIAVIKKKKKKITHVGKDVEKLYISGRNGK